MSEIGHLHNVNVQLSSEVGDAGRDAALAAAKALTTDRAAHVRELEEQAAKLEHDNELRRHEKAAEERLHRAEKEAHDLEHPAAPFPFNLLHSQAEGDGHVAVAAADAGHAGVIDATASDHADVHVEVVAHADEHNVSVAAGHDAEHVVDHSHDAMPDSGAA
ncbi:MAG: hypothetical protein ABJD07_10505 [Gemmatimonadaceae bacterium]